VASIDAWQDRRNGHNTTVDDWRFTTTDALIKLKNLYRRFS
jgi:hypothetical protein